MPGQFVSPVHLPASAFSIGVNTRFLDAYKTNADRLVEQIRDFADVDVPSTRRVEEFVHAESAADPVRVEPGESAPSKGFRGLQWSTKNYPFRALVEWLDDDETDDKAGMVLDRARNSGDRWAYLLHRIVFQIITASSNPTLLPSVPNAPDGAALFATTAEGVNRFGVSLGNLLNGDNLGGGLSNEKQVVKTINSVIAQFGKMLDTEGQPLHPEGLIQQGITIIANVDNREVLRRATQGQIMLQTTNNAGVSSGTIVAAGSVSNTLVGDLPIKLYLTPRITDNSLIFNLNGSRIKAIYHQTLETMKVMSGDETNSDDAKKTGKRFLSYKSREGGGVGPAFAMIKVTHT